MWIKIAGAALLASTLVGCVVAPEHGSNRGHGNGYYDRGHTTYSHPSDHRNPNAKYKRHGYEKNHGHHKYKNHSNKYGDKHWQRSKHRD